MVYTFRKNKAQALIEYSIFIIVILAVFLSMKDYVKRGIQGRWKTSVDDLGDQYDPRTANSMVNYAISSSANSFVDIAPAEGGGYYTRRMDVSNTVETKGGQSSVNTYNNAV